MPTRYKVKKNYWVGVRRDKFTGHDVFEDEARNVTEKKYLQYEYTIGPYTKRSEAKQRAKTEKNQTGMFTDPFCNNGGGR